ncbi:MAG TPA: type II toxin-antitoxin system PemK/MazF family toxin [Conexibacter sp.]|nr:type II toxin-antitoxin system PemK/MazF family toxin [Conexibacter sp.]
MEMYATVATPVAAQAQPRRRPAAAQAACPRRQQEQEPSHQGRERRAGSEWAEILDFKRPGASVLVGRRDRAKLSEVLADAVAQLREYGAFFDDREAAARIEKSVCIRCYRPKLTVIIARSRGYTGNVLLTATRTGLPKDAVANVSQIVTIDRSMLTERVGRLSAGDLQLVLSGIDLVLGRD